MSSPAKPAALSQQIELFDSWFAAPTETEHSRTLAFWDVIPWHLISHQRKGRNPEVITFDGVKIDDSREVSVHLTPAILAPLPNSAGTRVLFPGVREELVERVLRKMAVHKLADSEIQQRAGNGTIEVGITFSLHQLRKELESSGHEFKLSDIRESLEVMHLCNVRVECPKDTLIHRKSGPILGDLETIVDPNDEDGERSLYRASFHPLASAAIMGELYHPINYARVMALSQPLARWITNLLNVRFRYATRGIAEKKRSFRLTLKRVLTDSGMRPEPRIRDNIQRVRDAIEELRKVGFLDMGMSLDRIETLKHERTTGRPRINAAEWELYPSDRFAREIIEGNIAKRNRQGGRLAELPGA